MPLGDTGNTIVGSKVESRGKDGALKRQPLNSSELLQGNEGLVLGDPFIFEETLEILYVIFLIFKVLCGTVQLFGELVRICGMSPSYLWSKNLITTG